MTSNIYFDVGANTGDTFRTQAQQGHQVFAFEPTPSLCDGIRQWCKDIDTYTLVQKAVSDFNGFATFHIGDRWDGGVSSLNEFSDNLDKTWPGRTDLVYTNSCEVEVVRLDDWIDENIPNIPKITYLHVDTQGTDLKVLQGLGKYINLVEAGQIEVPHSPEVALYKGQHTEQEAIAWLESHNFVITGRTSQMNEDNIVFRRKS